MVMLRALFTLASLCSISGIWGLPSDASSSPPSIRRLSKRFDEHTVHEERSHLPQHWEKRAGGLDKRKIIPVRFNVVQRNMDRAEEFLMEVSDPKSPKYGMHYKPEDVVDLVSVDLVSPTIGDLTYAVGSLKVLSITRLHQRDRRLVGRRGPERLPQPAL